MPMRFTGPYLALHDIVDDGVAFGELPFEHFTALRTLPALVPVTQRRGAVQVIADHTLRVRGERFVQYPHGRQHRQLPIRAVELVALDQRVYALGFQHAAEEVRLGRVFRGVDELHDCYCASNARRVKRGVYCVPFTMRKDHEPHRALGAESR